MAKDVYSIPYDINKNQLDRQFSIGSSKDGWRLIKHPVSLLTLLMWVSVFILLLYIELKTFIGSGSVFGGILFAIGFVLIGFILSWRDDTKRYGFQLISLYIEYVLKKTRELVLYRSTPLSRARKFFGVKYVRSKGVEDGYLDFEDGRKGRLMLVTGNASAMMFSDDRVRVLDATETFYRNVSEHVDVIIDTLSEPQKVDEQLAENERRKKALNNDFLSALYDEQAYYLKTGIGGYVDPDAKIEADDVEVEGYRSIHQYLMLIGDSKQDLVDLESMVYDEVDSRGLVFKYVKPLGYKDVIRYYESLFN